MTKRDITFTDVYTSMLDATERAREAMYVDGDIHVDNSVEQSLVCFIDCETSESKRFVIVSAGGYVMSFSGVVVDTQVDSPAARNMPHDGCYPIYTRYGHGEVHLAIRVLGDVETTSLDSSILSSRPQQKRALSCRYCGCLYPSWLPGDATNCPRCNALTPDASAEYQVKLELYQRRARNATQSRGGTHDHS